MLQKDYARAALQFQNAIQVMPRDAEAQYQLGLAELAAGQIMSAVNTLRKATELNPGHAGAQVKLAEIMALSGIKEVVREGQHRVQDVLRNSPGNIEALDTLALSEIQLGQLQDAQAHLEEALREAPQSIASVVALAKLYLSKRDLPAAEEVLKKAVQSAPQLPEAATALGQMYILTGKWNAAEGQFRAALKINPKFALAMVGDAMTEIGMGHKDRAEDAYRKLSTAPEKQYRHLYAAYLFQEGKHDSAIKELERLARQDPGDREARTRLIAAYVLVNRSQDAEKILAAALKSNSNDLDALLQRSQISIRAGKSKEAEADLAQVLHYQPDSARCHYLLANVYRARGNSIREQHELGEAIRFDPRFLAARIELAQSLIVANSAKNALGILDNAPDNQKRVLGFIIQRNWALLALDEQAEVRKWVNQGLALVHSPDLLMQDSILKLKQRDYAGARVDAGEVLQKDPEDVRALRVIAASYVAQKQPAAAVKALQDHASKHPKSAAAQQFLGEWLMANGDRAQARAAFLAAKTANPNSSVTDMALARLDISEGKLDDARKTITAILSSNNPAVEPLLWLGSIEVKLGNYTVAIEHFRKVLQEDDSNLSALNNLAYLLANFAHDPEEALAFAQKARELAPDSADAQGTLGWVFYRKGLYSIALKHLREAVAKDGESSAPNAAIRKYHLAMAYLKLGERDSGLKAMQAALKIDPKLPQTEIDN